MRSIHLFIYLTENSYLVFFSFGLTILQYYNNQDDSSGPMTAPPAPPPPPPPAPASDGLGVAQIVITAATPMMEEPEKPFGQENSPTETEPEQPNTPVVQPESVPEEDHRMSVDSDYFPATIPEESEDELKMLESDDPGDTGLPSELEPRQLAKLRNLKESNA